MAISSHDLREKYIAFFESKGHTRIPSAPLVPENDPSVLFTTAGMHPLVPYLKGQEHPAGTRLVDAQKCLRTTDIEEIGDSTHATVFEMLGNWSLGDYFKKDSITWSWEFLTDKAWLGLNPNRLAVSVFAGDTEIGVEQDTESYEIWKSLGVPEERIAFLDKDENWWPAGGKHPGPQGPDTEIFYWTGEGDAPKEFDATNDAWVEIWNNVFMQFNRNADGSYEELPKKNVDTGMGLERTVMILNGQTSIYEVDTFQPLFGIIDAATSIPDERNRRILADHIKAATFILGDSTPTLPSNTDQGYVLRRLIRRAVGAARALGVDDISKLFQQGAEYIIDSYSDAYPSLLEHKEVVITELDKEIQKFDAALARGKQKVSEISQNTKELNGQHVFELHTTFGLPLDVIENLAGEHGMTISKEAMKEIGTLMEKHRDLSRTAAAGKFKGGLADHSEKSVHYHTATHLLHQALRTVLGDHVVQRGSNITQERLRFDFSHPDKMTPEQIAATENLVNEQITKDIPVTREEMSVAQAKEKGALGLFEDKYGDTVSVYSMGDFSCEICGGPHVDHTGVLGTFKIAKEESASSGVRRIKAILE